MGSGVENSALSYSNTQRSEFTHFTEAKEAKEGTKLDLPALALLLRSGKTFLHFNVAVY